MLVRQSAGHLVGQHGFQYQCPVAGQRRLDSELLRVDDPTEVLAEDGST